MQSTSPCGNDIPERIRANRFLRLRRKSGKRFSADLVREDFRLANANHQKPKDSTSAIKPILVMGSNRFGLADQAHHPAVPWWGKLIGSCPGFLLSPMLPNLPSMNTPPFSDLLDNNVSKTVSCHSTVNHSTNHDLQAPPKKQGTPTNGPH
jgi:hypothetical protein